MKKTALSRWAVAFVAGWVWIGCGQDEGSMVSGSDPLSPEALTPLAKKPDGGPGNGGGNGGGGDKGSTEVDTFVVTVEGNANGTTTGTEKINSNTDGIGFGYFGQSPWMDISPFFQGAVSDGNICFSAGSYSGPIIVGTPSKNGINVFNFWFKAVDRDGKPVTYILQMTGDFETGKPWPPTLDESSNIITATSWEIVTEGKKSKNACTDVGGFTLPTTVTVVRKP